MDGGADLNDRGDEPATRARPKPVLAADDAGGEPDGEGTPRLALDGFDGPLARLLTLAQGRQVDLTRLSLTALVEQLTAALQRAPVRMPLGQKADWVVMAAWLLQLRSGLLLPVGTPAQQAATAEADALRGSLVELQAMQALAAWLDGRPQPGRDVFMRGQPEIYGVPVEPPPDLDIIEFLWASLALFDDGEPEPDTMPVYRPRRPSLHAVGEARERILRFLAETTGAVPFEQLLPYDGEAADNETKQPLRRRSAWSSTLVASLELAKQGAVLVEQDGAFQPIHLASV